MLPPDFVRYLEGGGVRAPHCMVCAHAADFEREQVCMEYGAYVSLYSSCGSFERREQGLPIVDKQEVEKKFGFGLLDLTGRKK